MQALYKVQVHTLDLSENKIAKHAPTGVQALYHTQVHTLDLTDNNITYQKAFSENMGSVPMAIARRIMAFLGYENDKNLQKRFLNRLRTNSISHFTLLTLQASNRLMNKKLLSCH